MSAIRIVGILLARNEDRFVERVVRNVFGFCDELILLDHRSTDETPALLRALAEEHPGGAFHAIEDPSASHTFIQPFAGTPTWVFAVDGDEIYDPAGLLRFRKELLAGVHAQTWQLFGNVLNCVELNVERGIARGYLAPPSRSMTKLYNFAAIDAWEGPCPERLHGGHIRFRPGYDAAKAVDISLAVPWESAMFRCLHVCMLPRSRLDMRTDGTRPNITEINARRGWYGQLRAIVDLLRGRTSGWKRRKYMRGPVVTSDVRAFFPRNALSNE